MAHELAIDAAAAYLSTDQSNQDKTVSIATVAKTAFTTFINMLMDLCNAVRGSQSDIQRSSAQEDRKEGKKGEAEKCTLSFQAHNLACKLLHEQSQLSLGGGL